MIYAIINVIITILKKGSNFNKNPNNGSMIGLNTFENPFNKKFEGILF